MSCCSRKRVLAQDRGDLALVLVDRADRAVEQEVSALADIRERRLELVRHVPQEPVALERDVEEARAQPFELAAKRGEVRRPADRDHLRERAAAEVADRAVDGAERAQHVEPEDAGDGECGRHERHDGPQQALLRRARLALDVLEPGVDAEARPLCEPVGFDAEDLETAHDGRGRHACCAIPDEGGAGFAGGPDLIDIRFRHVVGELLQRPVEGRVVRLEGLGDARVIQHRVQVRGAFHGRDVLEQDLGVLGEGDAVPHQQVAGAREFAQLHAAVDERCRQRQDDQEERRRQQPAQ